jgi:hypothetical protein
MLTVFKGGIIMEYVVVKQFEGPIARTAVLYIQKHGPQAFKDLMLTLKEFNNYPSVQH